jgi:hypothetical protein
VLQANRAQSSWGRTLVDPILGRQRCQTPYRSPIQDCGRAIPKLPGPCWSGSVILCVKVSEWWCADMRTLSSENRAVLAQTASAPFLKALSLALLPMNRPSTTNLIRDGIVSTG